jgi:lysophospholipase L1-like esterase
VLLLSVLPVSWKMNQYYLINERICKFADDKTVYYLDLAPEFLKKDQKNKTQHLHDGLHPTEEGYRIMANKLIPVIDKILAAKE